ncbi:hypothetical protein SDC9_128805 [bioreactor metagenome]|uniref:Uncharacterized protein n=1 Tax=bioreactor metagenome TaxID=1076179 RepID=A0A645CY42_9ZZZZ
MAAAARAWWNSLAIVETKYAIFIPSVVFSAGAAGSAAVASVAAAAAAGASSLVAAGVVLWQANMENTMSMARTSKPIFFILCLPPSCFMFNRIQQSGQIQDGRAFRAGTEFYIFV